MLTKVPGNMPDWLAELDPADREQALFDRLDVLRNALRVALDYIENDLNVQPPENITRLRNFVVEASRTVVTDPPRDFAGVVAGAARFLSSAAEMPAFGGGTATGLFEWLILLTVSTEPPGLTDRQIFRLIGATHKRTRRILDALAASRMVALAPTPKGSGVTIRLTAAGEAHLEATNAKLLPTLQRFLYRNPLQIRSGLRAMRLLARVQSIV